MGFAADPIVSGPILAISLVERRVPRTGGMRMDKELCPLCGNNEIDPETEENCEECEETARDHGKNRED